MIKPKRPLLAAACVASLLVVAVMANAQSLKRTLHEYFQPPESYGALQRAGRDGAGGGDPARPSPAASQPPRTPARAPGAPPPLTLSASEDEPIVDEQGLHSARELEAPQGGLDPLAAQNRLDDDTDRVDELDYFSSFDPSVIPFKRLVAQNAVSHQGGQYVFAVEPGRASLLPVGGQQRGDEDVFWGTFLVKAKPGVALPVASVAPNQRVLEIISEPPVTVGVQRDEAGNHALLIEADELVRVNMKIAVPRSYFVGRFDPTSWENLERSLVIDLPDEARRQARRVLGDRGISPSDEPHEALLELIAYFRDFKGEAFPDSLRAGDLYYAIASNQIGVCRHRSFAFVITASALGIPARYVYNEAHAFVEVHWPGLGWRRVDLGGAAEDVLMRSQGDQSRVHDVGEPDVLPQPAAFREEMERLAEQETERRERSGEGDGDNGGFDFEDGPMNRLDDEQRGEASGTEQGEPPPSTDGASERDGDAGQELAYDPEAWGEDQETRRLVAVRLEEYPSTLQRGEPLRLVGQLIAEDDAALGARPLRVVLSSPRARDASRGRLLGGVTTDAAGRFVADLTVPLDLEVGRWSLVVVFDGDEEYAEAQSP